MGELRFWQVMLLINSTPEPGREFLRHIGKYHYWRREGLGTQVLGTRRSSTWILKSPLNHERGHIEENNNKSEQKSSRTKWRNHPGNVINNYFKEGHLGFSSYYSHMPFTPKAKGLHSQKATLGFNLLHKNFNIFIDLSYLFPWTCIETPI